MKTIVKVTMTDNYSGRSLTFHVSRRWCGTQAFNLSVNAILKKEELLPEDYETNGERWIYELK